MSIFKDFTLKLRLQNSGIYTCFVLVISQVFNVYLSITKTFHIKFWIFGGVLCVETRCVAMAVLESIDQAALELRAPHASAWSAGTKGLRHHRVSF